jgi:hypothetical protein
MPMPRVVARIRVPSLLVGVVLVLVSPVHHLAWISWFGIALILLSLATTFMPGGRVKGEPIPVHCPVRGRWIAVPAPEPEPVSEPPVPPVLRLFWMPQ